MPTAYYGRALPPVLQGMARWFYEMLHKKQLAASRMSSHRL